MWIRYCDELLQHIGEEKQLQMFISMPAANNTGSYNMITVAVFTTLDHLEHFVAGPQIHSVVKGCFGATIAYMCAEALSWLLCLV